MIKINILVFLLGIFLMPFANSAEYPNSGKTFCTLSIGTDDGRDLSPDGFMAMIDAQGRPLVTVPMSNRNDNYYIEMKSGPISVLVDEESLIGQKTVRLGVQTEKGPVYITNEIVPFEEVVTLTLDLSQSSWADDLGKKYDECDEKPCLANVVYLTCGPKEKIEQSNREDGLTE